MPEKVVVDDLSTEHLRSDLKGRSIRGGALTLTSQGTQFVIQSVSTVVLARLLTPSDFGLVAMVTAITGLGQAFADLGLSEATIQRKEITHDQISVLFWVNVAIGFGLMAMTAASAPVLAKFYRDPRLVYVTLWLSLTFLIGGLRVQPDALLKRQMRFNAIAVRDIAASVAGVTVGIVMALRGFGYWALVAVPVVLSSTVMVLSWLFVKWRPGLPRRNTGARSLVAFGGNVAASYLLFTIDRSADNIMIGRHWGAGPLGLYSRAYNLLMLPVNQMSLPAGSVVITAFSRLQGDLERFARYYLRTANLMMWISAPLFGFLFVAAHPVVILILGRQWGEAAPVFQILAISGPAQLILNLTVWLFISKGQSGLLLKVFLIISPIIIGAYAIGLPFGIRGVALTGSLAVIVVLPWMLNLAFRDLRLTLRNMGRALVCPISVSLAAVAVSETVWHFTEVQGILASIFVVVCSFAAACLLAVLIPPVRREMFALKTLLNELRRSGRVEPQAA